MDLTPREKDKLLIVTAALLADRRMGWGVKLNYPDAMAYLSAAILEETRDGRTVAERMSHGATLVTPMIGRSDFGSTSRPAPRCVSSPATRARSRSASAPIWRCGNRPSSAKPATVLKGGMFAAAAMCDPNASIRARDGGTLKLSFEDRHR